MELMPVYGVFFQKKEFFTMKKKSRSQGKNRENRFARVLYFKKLIMYLIMKSQLVGSHVLVKSDHQEF